MPENDKSWMKPEEALSRFKKPKEYQIGNQQTGASKQSSRYGFVIKNIGFLIAEKTLSEVVKNPSVYPVPNTRKWMKGLINLRGNLVPVYDLPLLTGLSSEESTSENLLVLGKGNGAIGVLIEGVPRSCDADAWQSLSRVPCELGGLEEHVNRSYSDNNIVWVDFNEQSYFESLKESMAV